MPERRLVAARLAIVYPRLRAGLRGTVAIACGALALTAGVVDGVRHVLVDRLAGDDLLVMPASVAGLVLTAVGVATLWRHRQPDRPRRLVRAVAQRCSGRGVPGRRDPVPHARHGYGVLLFDRRGEGESDGDFNTFRWGGDTDLKAALAFLGGRRDVDPQRIGGLGLSVGGEMLLETAAEDHRLRAVVSDGASVRSLAEHWDDPDIPALRKPFTPEVVQTLAVGVLAGEGPPPSLMDLVADISPRAVLFIRGLAGQPAGVLNRSFHAAAGAPKPL